MDLSEARRITDEALPWLKWALQLQEWDITLSWQHCSPDDSPNFATKATAQPDPKYKILLIRIDPMEIDSEEDLLETLLHELVHALDSEWELFRRMALQLASESEDAMLHEAYAHAKEQTRFRVEAMLLHGLGLSPRRLIKRAKKHARRTT